jgi:hypothetical protein
MLFAKYIQNRNMSIILFALMGFIAISNLQAQDNWTLERDRDGIKVYNKRLEGSKLKAFKGIAVMKSSPKEVLKYLKDHTQHDKFMYKAKPGSVEVVKRVSDDEFYTYLEIVTPWPAQSRDVVSMYKFSTDKKGVITCELKGFPDMVPQKHKIVRVPKMEGYWRIEPLEGGLVRVTVESFSEPGGNVPEGMANSASVDAPFSMLSKLRALVEN